MSRVIYKYLLNIDSNEWTFGKPWFDIELPFNHQVLSAVSQNNMPHIYAIVDPDSTTMEPVKRRFFVVHTGEGPPLHGRFIGTCVLMQKKIDQTDYVIHVFEGPLV
jgi:hypothetical protein